MAEQNPTALLQQSDTALTTDPKKLRDLSEKVNVELARLPSDFEAALEALLALEKETRHALDGDSSCAVVDRLIELCLANGHWDRLLETAGVICRKRGQLKKVVTQILQRGSELKCPSVEMEKKLLTTFAEMSNGKIFVEVQRARLVLRHALLLEREGDLDAAAKVVQDVPVEAFGGMDTMERSQYILEQMRLVLARQDYLRLQILSKKISTKALETEDMRAVKRVYNEYLVRYFVHEDDPLAVANAWKSIAETYAANGDLSDKVPADSLPAWVQAIDSWVHWLLLAPHSPTQIERLQHFKKTFESDKHTTIALSKRLVNDYLQFELVDWPLPYEAELRKSEPLSDEKYFERFRSHFHQRNVLVLTKCFTRVMAADAAAMLRITAAELERTVSDLVNAGTIYAKIDRPHGVIEFRKPREPTDILDKWTEQIGTILDLVQETTHLINNERMLHLAK